MPSTMKALMDRFYAEERKAIAAEDYTASFVYSCAENLANNCHQFTPDQIREYLKPIFERNRDREKDTPEQKQAWARCLIILAEIIPSQK